MLWFLCVWLRCFVLWWGLLWCLCFAGLFWMLFGVYAGGLIVCALLVCVVFR